MNYSLNILAEGVVGSLLQLITTLGYVFTITNKSRQRLLYLFVPFGLFFLTYFFAALVASSSLHHIFYYLFQVFIIFSFLSIYFHIKYYDGMNVMHILQLFFVIGGIILWFLGSIYLSHDTV